MFNALFERSAEILLSARILDAEILLLLSFVEKGHEALAINVNELILLAINVRDLNVISGHHESVLGLASEEVDGNNVHLHATVLTGLGEVDRGNAVRLTLNKNESTVSQGRGLGRVRLRGARLDSVESLAHRHR